MTTTLKRIMREVAEMKKEVEKQREPPWIFAEPMGDNLFEWHFTIQGPPETPYEKGLYHGRIILPNEYPFKPPNIFILTPNGRFQVNQKICLNVTGFHPEHWQPAWGIRVILVALQGFFAVETDGMSVGAVQTPYSSEERTALAKKSLSFKCEKCASQTAREILVRAFGNDGDERRLELFDPLGNLRAAEKKPEGQDGDAASQIQFYIPPSPVTSPSTVSTASKAATSNASNAASLTVSNAATSTVSNAATLNASIATTSTATASTLPSTPALNTAPTIASPPVTPSSTSNVNSTGNNATTHNSNVTTIPDPVTVPAQSGFADWISSTRFILMVLAIALWIPTFFLAPFQKE